MYSTSVPSKLSPKRKCGAEGVIGGAMYPNMVGTPL